MNKNPASIAKLFHARSLMAMTVSVETHAWTLLRPVTLERLHCITLWSVGEKHQSQWVR